MMESDEIVEAVKQTGTLPPEIVICALTAALCSSCVEDKIFDVSVGGLGFKVSVTSESISILGCQHCFDDGVVN